MKELTFVAVVCIAIMVGIIFAWTVEEAIPGIRYISETVSELEKPCGEPDERDG